MSGKLMLLETEKSYRALWDSTIAHSMQPKYAP